MIQLIVLSKDQTTSKDLKYTSMRSPRNCNKVKLLFYPSELNPRIGLERRLDISVFSDIRTFH